MPARVAVAIALLALAAAPPALADGGGKPNGDELWRTYPLKPKTSATASGTSTPAKTARPAATPTPAPSGGGAPWLPIGLVILAAAGGAGLALRRRRPTAAPAPAEAQAPAPEPQPAPRRTGRFKPRSDRPSRRFQPTRAPERRFEPTQATERLREAVDIRLAREWPWPAGSERLWRCEIGPDPAALSARFRAVVHPPDGEPPRVLAVSPTGRAAGNWQSAKPLEEAVNALAAHLESEGWEAVDGGGDPHTRRFCWRREGAPHIRMEENAWAQ